MPSHSSHPVGRRTRSARQARSVAIVGGGIHGVLCAYMLARQGYRVELFEKGPLPNPDAASHGRHRLIHPWTAAGNAALAQAAWHALALWRDILGEIGSDGFLANGVLAVDDRSGLDFDALGIPSVEVSGAELGRLLPFLDRAAQHRARLFPEFGLLFASQILDDLIGALRQAGVGLHAHATVRALDPETGDLRLASGAELRADRIVLAAGTGTRALLPVGLRPRDPSRFAPRRCYVAYVAWPDASMDEESPAWASLGAGDLWGMPPVRGGAMKLGNGAFTRPADPAEPEDAAAVGALLLDSYRERCPALRSAELVRAGANHWTWIGAPKTGFAATGRLLVVTSDDGGGFKTAPQVAQAIAAHLAAAEAA